MQKNNAYLKLNEVVDVTSKIITNDSINNNLKVISNTVSNLWGDITDKSLIIDTSAPKALINSTLLKVSSDPLLNHAYINFLPTSVSTPIKNVNVNNSNVYYSSKKLDEVSHYINNGTYNELVTHNQNNEKIYSNLKKKNSTSSIKLENLSERCTAEKYQNDVQSSTFVLKDCLEENISVDANDLKSLLRDIHSSPSFKDERHNKSDEQLTITDNKVTDLNSTIIKKSNDNDNEQDSCYSSSSNKCSLGDVYFMSQLQPQKNSEYKINNFFIGINYLSVIFKFYTCYCE